MNGKEQRFYWQDLDEDPNVADLLISVAATLGALPTTEDALFGIVDEQAGGIIAYALGQDNAAQIVKALEDA